MDRKTRKAGNVRKLALLLILCFASSLLGNVATSHWVPYTPKLLNLGSDANEWNRLEVVDVNINNELIVWNDANIYGTLTALLVNIDGGTIDGVTIGTNSACTELQVDLINIDGSTITHSGEEKDFTITSNTLGALEILAPNAETGIQINAASGSIYLLSNWTAAGQTCADLGTVSLGALHNDVTHTQWDAAYTHVSNNGTDHGYINQDVQTIASPTFVTINGTNFISVLTSGDALYARAGNYDVNIWRIDFDDGNYGFYQKYVGTGSGLNNALELWTQGQTGTDIQVYKILQNGQVEFYNPSFYCGALYATVYGGDATLNTRHAAGTRASPTATQLNDIIYFSGGRGFDGTNFGNNSKIVVIGTATENYTSTAQGVKMGFYTTPNGSVTRALRMLIDQDGALSIAGQTLFQDKIKFTQTDGNEFIDSLNDGYMDYGATTGHRINVGGSYEYTLPVADGSADEIIKTDGSGTLSFVRMPKAIYAELSDSTDQEFAVVGEPNVIAFDTNDEIAGITHSTPDSNITIITTGVYTIFAQPQVAAGSGGAGVFHMWLQKDTGGGFADIANTNIELSLASGEEDVIPLATTFLLDAGDIIRLSASVSDIKIKLDAQTPAGEPAIPSIIFTMFMIGT